MRNSEEAHDIKSWEDVTKNLPPIPAIEWVILGIGIILFGISEVILYASGYTDLLLNTIASLMAASIINYGVFHLKKIAKRLVSAIKMLASFIQSIPRYIAGAIYIIILGIVYLLAGILFILGLIPPFIKWLIKVLPKVIAFIIPAFALLVGILLLNVVMIPVLAIYLTIYGLIFSLSGGASKILLKHYDAFGHEMIAPVEEYILYEFIVFLIMVGITIVLLWSISAGLETTSSIAATNAANAAVGNTLSMSGTLLSYLPVFAFIIGIGIIIIILRSFWLGAWAFNAGLR